MTEKETKQVLSVLKAAYPNAFKGMNREDALDMVHLWTAQFADIPAGIMGTAVKRVLYKCKFLPTIAEVTEELLSIRYETEERLNTLSALCSSALATAEMKRCYEENRILHGILQKGLPKGKKNFPPLRERQSFLTAVSVDYSVDSLRD